jgi:L-ascorbate metabolism protein UlaG (beta-lactamase superfamily)
MKVKFIYSACVDIQTSGITILTDPWFTDGVMFWLTINLRT